MTIIQGKEFELKNTCVTIGKFDGLHRGHQKLLTEMEKYREEYTTVMINFDFNEFESTLKKCDSASKIYSDRQKIEFLSRRGPEILIQYPFDAETAAVSAYDFLHNVLIGQLDAKIIVAGANFRFGNKAQGDTDFLKAHETEFNYKTVIVPCEKKDGEIVSSTSIRSKIRDGKQEDAEYLLNKNFW